MKTVMIVLNYNDAELTAEHVKVIQSYRCVNHIVVVDNCSTDGSFERLVPLQSDKTAVIKTKSNEGYGAGNNYGIRFARGEFDGISHVIISNPDIKVEESSIEKLLASFHSRPNQFAVTGIIYPPQTKAISYSGGELPSLFEIFMYSSRVLPYLVKRVRSMFDRHSSQIKSDSTYSEMGYLMGCFFIADCEKWDEIGGFSEKTFLGMEEPILFFESRKRGFVSGVVSDATIIHYGSHSILKSVNTMNSIRNFQRGQELYLSECLGVKRPTIALFKIWNKLFFIEQYLIIVIVKLRKTMKDQLWSQKADSKQNMNDSL